jgi:hypothetical protein
MNTLILIIAVGLGVAVVGYLYQRQHRRSTFAGRDTLNLEEIYRTYYSASGIPADRVTELWREVALALKVPAEKLRPTDTFGKELGGGYIVTSEDLDALTAIAQRRAKAMGLTIGFEQIKSLDDYVRLFGTVRR